MSNGPLWNRRQDPWRLHQYVQAGAAAAVLNDVPLRAHDRSDGPTARLQQWFDAFVSRGIQYADETLESRDGWQEIRPPTEVLAGSRIANCVDLAVTFAGACLDAGIHPIVLLLESETLIRAHALVVVWLEDLWPGIGGHRRYSDAAPRIDGKNVSWPSGLRTTLKSPGGFLPVDITVVAQDVDETSDATLAAAVISADKLLRSMDWRVSHVLDIGREWDPRGALVSVPRATGITTYAEEVAALRGLRSNLLEGNLPFVPPSEMIAPAHPDQLLKDLSRAADNGRGLLLVGGAGVGKTRTCFEVARRAIDQGWAVLYVTAGEPLVTTQQMYEAVQQTRCDRVLVVLDYLNECSGIDFQALRQRYLPAAGRAGITMALLASCRVGWHSNPDRPVNLVFDPIPLEPDVTQATATRDAILKSIAPKAIGIVGMAGMQQLCGLRPVITMLVAAEAERLANDGSLSTAVNMVRPEDLLSWLQRRLTEDRLIPPRAANPFSDETDDPSFKLQACLAMLVASPQDRAAMLACGDAVRGLSTGQSELLLAHLQTMGWVVDQAHGLGPVHDLVTDQLVERMMFLSDEGGIRAGVVDRVLSACLTRGRTIGRFSANLGRIARDLEPAKALLLIDRTGTWLAEHASVAGALLANTEDEGAYALGAVVDSVTWRTAAFEAWQELVAPWLARYSSSLTARHLLYKGLRSEDPSTVAELITDAFTWLDQHGATPEAGFVLGPLLGRDLESAAATTAVGHAFTWLDQQGTTPEAGFVLDPLLGRDLESAAATTAVGHAFTWLDQHGTTPGAQFILRPLLGRDLESAAATTAVGHAITWLDQHGTTPEAPFVLHPLLVRDLESAAATTAVGHAFTWLDHHGTTLGAQFVLHPLLGRDLDSTAATIAVGHAFTWLDHHGTTPGAQFVLHPLLGRDLDSTAATIAVGHAFTWLDHHGTTPEAQFVLHPLLGRDLDSTAATIAVGHAFTWLDHHGTTPDAQFVLGRLLWLRLADEGREPARFWAMRWIEENGAGSDLVTKFVIRQREVTERVAERLLTWAANDPHNEDIPWRLHGLARKVNDWPHLLPLLLAVVDEAVPVPDDPRSVPNLSGEFDSLLHRLCHTPILRCGIDGARLDDVLRRWAMRPEAFHSPGPPGSHFHALVSRMLSLFVNYETAPGSREETFQRLHEWIEHWQCSEHEDERVSALVTLDLHRKFHERRSYGRRLRVTSSR